MNADELGQIYRMYYPLTVLSTYPIVIKINNDIKIAWFIFNFIDEETVIDKNNPSVDILLYDFYFMDKNYNVTEIKNVNIKKSINYTDFKKPELDTRNYLIKLCELINNNTINENNNKELLNKSEYFWLTDILFDTTKKLLNQIYKG